MYCTDQTMAVLSTVVAQHYRPIANLEGHFAFDPVVKIYVNRPDLPLGRRFSDSSKAVHAIHIVLIEAANACLDQLSELLGLRHAGC